MRPKLGILAGSGRLPMDIIGCCTRTGRPFHVIAFSGQSEEEAFASVPHSRIRLGAGGATLKALRDNNVDEIVFVGGIVRPTLAQLRPDAWGLKFLARNGIMALGDDGALSAIIRTLEEKEGFRVVGVGDIAPELLAPIGVLGTITPTRGDQLDINVAVQAAYSLGSKDIGQAAVVRNGQVIGLEGPDGTDALLRRVTSSLEGEQASKPAGVLAKVCKPRQERRADLPTIGIDTVENVAAAGLAGIAIEAGGALVLERDAVVQKADALGIFIVGTEVGNGNG